MLKNSYLIFLVITVLYSCGANNTSKNQINNTGVKFSNQKFDKNKFKGKWLFVFAKFVTETTQLILHKTAVSHNDLSSNMYIQNYIYNNNKIIIETSSRKLCNSGASEIN